MVQFHLLGVELKKSLPGEGIVHSSDLIFGEKKLDFKTESG